jgi:hypothetical protein
MTLRCVWLWRGARISFCNMFSIAPMWIFRSPRNRLPELSSTNWLIIGYNDIACQGNHPQSFRETTVEFRNGIDDNRKRLQKERNSEIRQREFELLFRISGLVF